MIHSTHRVHIFLGAFAKLRKATIGFVMSVCSSVARVTTRLPLDGFSWKFILEYFSKIYWENSSLIKIWQEKTSTLHSNQYTFLVISRSVLLRMKNVSDKSYRETRYTHFMFNDFFFSFENRAVYEITWKNIVERGSHRLQYGGRALHAGYLRLQIHTQVV